MPLPPGVTFNPNNRTLSGTPTTAGTYRVTYRATDADGDVASRSFNIVISGDASPNAPTINNINAIQNSAFSQTLPTGSGGNGALTYALTGTLPNGVTFNASTRVLAGTPSQTGTFALVYRVTDTDGDSDTESFSLIVAVDSQPTIRAIDDLTGVVNSAFNVQLPAGSGGNQPLTNTAS